MNQLGFSQSATGRQSKLFGSGASAIALKIAATLAGDEGLAQTQA
jgi:hypothetical protein